MAIERIAGLPISPKPKMLPEMDGYEVCKRLKADLLTANISVIFVTAHKQSLVDWYLSNVGG